MQTHLVLSFSHHRVASNLPQEQIKRLRLRVDFTAITTITAVSKETLQSHEPIMNQELHNRYEGNNLTYIPPNLYRMEVGDSDLLARICNVKPCGKGLLAYLGYHDMFDNNSLRLEVSFSHRSYQEKERTMHEQVIETRSFGRLVLRETHISTRPWGFVSDVHKSKCKLHFLLKYLSEDAKLVMSERGITLSRLLPKGSKGPEPQVWHYPAIVGDTDDNRQLRTWFTSPELTYLRSETVRSLVGDNLTRVQKSKSKTILPRQAVRMFGSSVYTTYERNLSRALANLEHIKYLADPDGPFENKYSAKEVQEMVDNTMSAYSAPINWAFNTFLKPLQPFIEGLQKTYKVNPKIELAEDSDHDNIAEEMEDETEEEPTPETKKKKEAFYIVRKFKTYKMLVELFNKPAANPFKLDHLSQFQFLFGTIDMDATGFSFKGMLKPAVPAIHAAFSAHLEKILEANPAKSPDAWFRVRQCARVRPSALLELILYNYDIPSDLQVEPNGNKYFTSRVTKNRLARSNECTNKFENACGSTKQGGLIPVGTRWAVLGGRRKVKIYQSKNGKTLEEVAPQTYPGDYKFTLSSSTFSKGVLFLGEFRDFKTNNNSHYSVVFEQLGNKSLLRSEYNGPITESRYMGERPAFFSDKLLVYGEKAMYLNQKDSKPITIIDRPGCTLVHEETTDLFVRREYKVEEEQVHAIKLSDVIELIPTFSPAPEIKVPDSCKLELAYLFEDTLFYVLLQPQTFTRRSPKISKKGYEDQLWVYNHLLPVKVAVDSSKSGGLSLSAASKSTIRWYSDGCTCPQFIPWRGVFVLVLLLHPENHYNLYGYHGRTGQIVPIVANAKKFTSGSKWEFNIPSNSGPLDCATLSKKRWAAVFVGQQCNQLGAVGRAWATLLQLSLKL